MGQHVMFQTRRPAFAITEIIVQAEKVHKTPRAKPDIRTERLSASLPSSSDLLIVRTQVAFPLFSYSRLVPILFYRVGGSKMGSLHLRRST